MRFREFFPAGSVRTWLSGERAGGGKAGQPARLYETKPFEQEVPDDPHDFVICPGSGHWQHEFHILTKTGFFSLLFLSNVQIFPPKPVFSVKTRNPRCRLGFRVFGTLKTAGTPEITCFSGSASFRRNRPFSVKFHINRKSRNQFALQRARGFESHPIRHPTRLKRRFQAGFRVFGRCGLPGKFHMTRMFSERKPTPLKPWCDKTFRVFGSICQQMRRCQVPGNFYLCIFCQERKPIPLKPRWDKAFWVFGRIWEIKKRRIGHSIRCARKADYVFIPSPESIASAEEILD